MSKRATQNGLLAPMELQAILNWKGNLTEACRLAGYSNPNVASAKLARRPHVIAALREKQAELIKASASTGALQPDLLSATQVNATSL